MAKKKTAKDDITKVGISPLKGLNYSGNSDLDTILDTELAQRASHLDNASAAPYFQGLGVYNEELNAASMPNNTGGFSVPYGESSYDDTTLWGDAPEVAQNYGDIRAERQPWYSKILNGVGKAGVLAVSTALETAGLLYGVGQGIYNAATNDESETNLGGASAFLNGLWDNPITNALKNLNDASEEWMPNYYSKDEQENPLALRNIFSANTIGDKLLKNLGFMVGAFYGGIPASAAIGKLGTMAVKGARAASLAERAGMAQRVAELTEEAAGDVNKLNKLLQAEHLTEAERGKRILDGFDKVRQAAKTTRATTQTIGALGSAINEGAVEAINNSNDWANMQKMKANDDYQQRLQAINENYGGTGLEQSMKVKAAEDYQKTLEEIDKGKARMGNADLLLNIPILMASNMYQLGRLYSRGFDSTRRELGSFWNGHKLSGSLAKGTLKSDRNWKKGVLSALSKSNSEGLEEYLQQAASDGAGQAVADSISRFISSGKSGQSKNDVDDYIVGFGKSMADNFNDPNAWEQYMIGAVSSMFGMPVFGSQTKNAWLGKGAPVGVAGGFIGNYKDYMSAKEHEGQIAEYLNGRVKDPKFKALYDNLRKTDDLDKLINDSLDDDDKAKYKELQFEKLFNDINAAASSGHLEEFKALIGYNKDYTDQELEDIVKETSKNITADQQKKEDENKKAYIEGWLKANNPEGSVHTNEELKQIQDAENDLSKVNQRLKDDNYKDKLEGPFINRNGQMNVQEDENGVRGGEMISILEKNKNHLLDTINAIQKIRNDIDIETDGRLDDDQIALLTQMRAKIWNYDQRSAEMAYDIATNLGDVKDSQKQWKDKIEGQLKDAEETYKNASKQYNDAKNYSKDEKLIKKLEKNKDDAKRNLNKAKTANRAVNNVIKLLDMLTEEKETTSSEENAMKKGYGRQNLNGIGKVNQWLGINEDRFDTRNINSDEAQAILSDPKNVIALIQTIQKSTRDLDQSTRDKLSSEAYDLFDLANQKIAYNKKVREFLGDPNLINEAFKNEGDKVTQKQKDNKADELALRIKNADNMADLDNIIKEASQVDSDITKSALDKAKQSGDEDTKKFIEDYEKGNSFLDSFGKQAVSLPDEIRAGVLSTASSEWQNALTEGLDTYNTFINGMNEAADMLDKDNNPISKATAAGIRQILSDLGAATKATTTNKNVHRSTVKKGTSSKAKDKEASDSDKKDSSTLEHLEAMRKKKGGEEKETKTPIVPSRDDLEKDITEAIKDSYSEGVYKITSINDLSKELQDSISSFNEANPDNQINNKFIEDIVGKLIDANIVDNFNYDIDKQEGAEYGEETDNSTKAQEMSDNLKVTFKSDHPTEFRYNLDYKTPYEPDGANAKQLKAVQDLLKEYKAYQFVDKNYLGYIWQSNLDNGDDTPIYFLKSTDNKINTGKDSIIFMAVEWNDDAKESIKKKAFNNKSVNLSDEVKPVTIGDKQYQIVGVLSIGTQVTQEVSDAFGKLQSSLNAEFKEKRQDIPEGQSFVVSNVHTSIDSIYTGRLDKANDENDNGDKVSLYDFMTSNQGKDERRTSTEWGNGSNFQFGVVINDYLDTNDDNDSSDVEEPNSQWMDKNNGAILLFIPKPDGRFYPIRCTRRTVGQWLDSNADGTNTGKELLNKVIDNPSDNSYLGNILNNLRTLFNSDSEFVDRVKAKVALSKYFIFGKNSPIHFEDDNVWLTFPSESSKKNVTIDITEEDVNGKIQQFFDILADNNIMFTLPKPSDTPINGRDIIKSGVLEVGLRGFYNFNANFTVTPIDEKGNVVAIAKTEHHDDTPPLGSDRPNEIKFDLGDGLKTYTVDNGTVYLEGKPLEDTDKQNVILLSLEAEQGNMPLAINEIGLSKFNDKPDVKKEVASKITGFDKVYIIHGNKDWIYDGRFANHDKRLYRLDSDQGKKLQKEIQQAITKVMSSNLDIIKKLKGKSQANTNKKYLEGSITHSAKESEAAFNFLNGDISEAEFKKIAPSWYETYKDSPQRAINKWKNNGVIAENPQYNPESNTQVPTYDSTPVADRYAFSIETGSGNQNFTLEGHKGNFNGGVNDHRVFNPKDAIAHSDNAEMKDRGNGVFIYKEGNNNNPITTIVYRNNKYIRGSRGNAGITISIKGDYTDKQSTKKILDFFKGNESKYFGDNKGHWQALAEGLDAVINPSNKKPSTIEGATPYNEALRNINKSGSQVVLRSNNGNLFTKETTTNDEQKAFIGNKIDNKTATFIPTSWSRVKSLNSLDSVATIKGDSRTASNIREVIPGRMELHDEGGHKYWKVTKKATLILDNYSNSTKQAPVTNYHAKAGTTYFDQVRNSDILVESNNQEVPFKADENGVFTIRMDWANLKPQLRDLKSYVDIDYNGNTINEATGFIVIEDGQLKDTDDTSFKGVEKKIKIRLLGPKSSQSSKPTRPVIPSSNSNTKGRFAGKELKELDRESADILTKKLASNSDSAVIKKIFAALQIAEASGNPIDDNKVISVIESLKDNTIDKNTIKKSVYDLIDERKGC